MDSNQLSLEFRELYLPWSVDPSTIYISVTIDTESRRLNYQNSIQVPLIRDLNDTEVHVVIQSDNRAYGSLKFSLAEFFNNEFDKETEESIKIEVPSEVVKMEFPDETNTKIMRVRIWGRVISIQAEEIEQSLEENKQEAEGMLTTQDGSNYLQGQVLLTSCMRGYLARKSTKNLKEGLEKKQQDEPQLGSSDESIVVIQSATRGYLSRKEFNESKTAIPEMGQSEDLTDESSVLLQSVTRGYLSRKELAQSKTLEDSPIENVNVNQNQDSTLIQSVTRGYLARKELAKIETKEDLSSEKTEDHTNEGSVLLQSVTRGYLSRKDHSSLKTDLISDLQVKSAARGYIARKALKDFQKCKTRPTLITIDGNLLEKDDSYLSHIKQTENYHKYALSILDRLKQELGHFFVKLLEEATNLGGKSPQKSPTRNGSRSGTRTPSKSPYKALTKASFTSLANEEETYLEIPSKKDVYLEKISGKTPQSLMLSIVGLITKRNIYDIQSYEGKAIKDLLDAKDKAIELLDSSMKETHEQIATEIEDLNDIENLVKDDLDRLKSAVEIHKKRSFELNHDKQTLENELNRLKQDKIQDHDEFDTEIIEKLRRDLRDAENERKEIQRKMNADCKDFGQKAEDLNAEQAELVNEKSEILENIKISKDTFQKLKLDQFVLNDEIKRLEGFIHIEKSQVNSKKAHDSIYQAHTQALKQANSAINKFKAQKEEFDSESLMIHQKIDADIRKYAHAQLAHKKDIESHDLSISEINKNLHNIKQQTTKIEEMFTKHQQIESSFQNLLKKYENNLEIKQKIAEELEYFSDFTFSLTKSYLTEHRLFKRLQLILQEKVYEINSMKLVVAEVKQNNPVYFPLKGDEIDEALADYLNSRDKEMLLPFIRETAGIYYYGTKKVLIKYERSKLSVKVGGGFLPIDDFIEAYTDSELEKFHLRNIGSSPRMKKFMAKWVGGLVKDDPSAPEKLREYLVRAVDEHSYASAIGVRSERISRSPSPSRKKAE